MYGRRWSKARLLFLRQNPLCRFCERMGLVSSAEVVDHIKPHRGDQTLFWDEANWQPLCKRCHDSVKQAEERSGTIRGVGLDGTPLDPKHWWNR